jgi:hypothetical protein
VTVGVSELQDFDEVVDVGGAVVAECLEIRALEERHGLPEDRPLTPGSADIDLCTVPAHL